MIGQLTLQSSRLVSATRSSVHLVDMASSRRSVFIASKAAMFVFPPIPLDQFPCSRSWDRPEDVFGKPENHEVPGHAEPVHQMKKPFIVIAMNSFRPNLTYPHTIIIAKCNVHPGSSQGLIILLSRCVIRMCMMMIR